MSEQHIYGSSRLGYVQTKKDMSGTLAVDGFYKRYLGEKRYEMVNHLGNVLVVISDRRFSFPDGGTGDVLYYESDVLETKDYDPFGMVLVERSWSAGISYRYGFSGHEIQKNINDNDILDFGARFYDSRLGKWFSIDIKKSKYPNLSPYSYCAGNPIIFIDHIGQDLYIAGDIIQAKLDISALLREENQCHVEFTEVSAGLWKVDYLDPAINSGCLTTLNNDAGTVLIQNLINADENYVYIASNTYQTIHRNDETKSPKTHDITISNEGIGGTMHAPFGVGNISTTARDVTKTTSEYALKNKAFNIPAPINGIEFQGQVTLAVKGSWVHNDGSKFSRGEMAFHELWENWERTTNGLPYEYPIYNKYGPTGIKDKNRKGAHDLSVDAQTGQGKYGEGIYENSDGYWGTKDAPAENAGEGNYTIQY